MASSPPPSEAAPEPPWWSARTRARARGGRPPLTREAVVAAAMAVLDRDGLDGLSMRRVADELGTGPATLYWHVSSKEDLLQMLFDRAVAELELPEPDPERWQEQLRAFGHQARATLLAHRDVARLSLGRVPVGPNFLRVAEWQLALLRGAGVPDRTAAWAGDLLGLYLGAFIYEESLAHSADDEDEERPPDPDDPEMAAYLEAVAPEHFPNLRALAAELMAGDLDARFAFGLEIIIGGIAAAIPADPDEPG